MQLYFLAIEKELQMTTSKKHSPMQSENGSLVEQAAAANKMQELVNGLVQLAEKNREQRLNQEDQSLTTSLPPHEEERLLHGRSRQPSRETSMKLYHPSSKKTEF